VVHEIGYFIKLNSKVTFSVWCHWPLWHATPQSQF